MFERYTASARRTLFFARYEASETGSRAIETEHVLLGLLRDVRGLVASVLEHARVSADDLRGDINRQLVFGETVPTSVEIPFSAATRRVLQRAAEEADTLLHGYIGTEHLLLALLSETDESLAVSVLAGRGVRLADAKEVILSHPHTQETFGAFDAVSPALFFGDAHARIANLERLVAELMRTARESPETRRVAENIQAELDALKALFD